LVPLPVVEPEPLPDGEVDGDVDGDEVVPEPEPLPLVPGDVLPGDADGELVPLPVWPPPVPDSVQAVARPATSASAAKPVSTFFIAYPPPAVNRRVLTKQPRCHGGALDTARHILY
jgi:hypothetical protein